MSRPGSRGCLRISGIASRATPTTTCPPRRTCSRTPPACSTTPKRCGHDPGRADPAGVLHRPSHPAAASQPRTIASYRDTLRLLLCFTQEHTGKQPATLDWDDLNETVITAFLQHLETDRHNTARTRNLRLTAIRSLFKYAALRHPEHASVIAQVLSIPPKRHQKRQISFLTAPESKALIDAPDQSRWEGRRDRAMLTLTIQAGLRVSELIALNVGDIQLGTGAHVRCEGKGRKQRTVPLTTPAQAVLTGWLTERVGRPTDPLFVTRTGRRLSRDAIEQRVTVHATTATATAHHSRANSYTRTSYGTAARCHSSKPASTPPSSPSG